MHLLPLQCRACSSCCASGTVAQQCTDFAQPTNFIQAVLKGVGDNEGAPGLVMPEYASSLSDGEIARLAAYLRRTRTKDPPWTDLENKVAAIRHASAKSR